MRIVIWNCNMALHAKYEHLLALAYVKGNFAELLSQRPFLSTRYQTHSNRFSFHRFRRHESDRGSPYTAARAPTNRPRPIYGVDNPYEPASMTTISLNTSRQFARRKPRWKCSNPDAKAPRAGSFLPASPRTTRGLEGICARSG
jgi:hypothetical protein